MRLLERSVDGCLVLVLFCFGGLRWSLRAEEESALARSTAIIACSSIACLYALNSRILNQKV